MNFLFLGVKFKVESLNNNNKKVKIGRGTLDPRNNPEPHLV